MNAATAQGQQSPVSLPPRYYRDNFLLVCRTVESQYADLLSVEETDWLAAFYALDSAAQCLYVRLISRVGPWFRPGSLVYAEIGDIESPLASLENAGFVGEPSSLSVEEVGRLFTRSLLRKLFPAVPGLPGANKAEDLAALQNWAGQDGCTERGLLATLRASGERLVGPLDREWVQTLQLLFFGNRRQGLSEFVLSELGLARYYPYRLDRENRLFDCREAVDDYLECAALADHFQALLECADAAGISALGGVLLQQPVVHVASERRWYRLRNRVARELERNGELELALALYRGSSLPPARERAVRVLEAQQNWAEALSACRQLIEAPLGEEEAEAAARMLPRLLRRSGERVPAQRRDKFSRLDLCLPRCDGAVEIAVAEAVSADWQSVHYVENSLMNSLFGLAFWEQIFSPLAGAFHNPFQSVPADMYDGGFVVRRRAALDQRLAELSARVLAQELREAYRRYFGYQCRWVNWQLLSPELLEDCLTVLPREHLLAIWRRQLFDPAQNRRGFPDLLALGASEGQYCMIEVKGPGDALQDSQKRWLRFFAGQGIPACVAWVTWSDE